jgi:mycothiol synthase
MNGSLTSNNSGCDRVVITGKENVMLAETKEYTRILPEGYTMRPVCMDDAEAVVKLENAWSRQALGLDKFTVEDTRGEWTSPGFELGRDARLVLAPDGQTVGYYEVWDSSDPHVRIICWGKVHPEHAGRGIGSAMLAWAEERARQSIALTPAGTRVVLVAFALSLDRPAETLLLDNGFEMVRHSLRMVIDMDGMPPEPLLPPGIVIRSMVVDKDLPTITRVVSESFRDHWGFVERPFDIELERWKHLIETFEPFDPAMWFLAQDGEQVAGVSLCYPYLPEESDLGWVGTLGVLRPWRRRGLGMALLQHSFRELHRRGRRKVGLGVDAQNLTGALRLYINAGMHSDETRQSSVFEKELRAGVDLSTQTV